MLFFILMCTCLCLRIASCFDRFILRCCSTRMCTICFNFVTLGIFAGDTTFPIRVVVSLHQNLSSAWYTSYISCVRANRAWYSVNIFYILKTRATQKPCVYLNNVNCLLFYVLWSRRLIFQGDMRERERVVFGGCGFVQLYTLRLGITSGTLILFCQIITHAVLCCRISRVSW